MQSPEQYPSEFRDAIQVNRVHPWGGQPHFPGLRQTGLHCKRAIRIALKSNVLGRRLAIETLFSNQKILSIRKRRWQSDGLHESIGVRG